MNHKLSTDQRGTTTLIVAAIVTFVAMAAMVAAGLATGVVTSHSARNAADMAALAGAFALARGEDACAQARAISQLNGATLTNCHTSNTDVYVQVSIGLSHAKARAGQT